MAIIKLTQFACPACQDDSQVHIEVEETTITEAERYPAIITARCPKDHSLVVFVDANFKIRDVEIATDATEE
ncbi:MAG: hypothetical protein ACXAAO_02020 [Candidatus Thorarchaeota archaeon]